MAGPSLKTLNLSSQLTLVTKAGIYTNAKWLMTNG